MPTLTTSDGIRLHYVDAAPDDADRTGPAVLIVPGWGGSTRWFEAQVEELSGQFRTICYDPRGQGQSQRTDAGQRMERLTKDLDELIHALELDQLILIGWSLGVSVALSYVDVFGTDLLQAVVFVCGGPKLINHDEWRLGFVDLEQAQHWVSLQRTSMQAAADHVLPQFFAQQPPQEQWDIFRANLASMSAHGSAAICWNVLNQDYTDVVTKVDVPALVITGSEDAVIPAGNGAYLVDALPHGQLRMFDRSAHCPFIEQPDEFNTAIATFARRIQPVPPGERG